MKYKVLYPFILGTALSAQTPSQIPAAKNPPPTTVIPALTELEQTKLQLEITQNMLLRQQEQELGAKHQATIHAINAAHPGFVYDERTQSLVPKPEVKK